MSYQYFCDACGNRLEVKAEPFVGNFLYCPICGIAWEYIDDFPGNDDPDLDKCEIYGHEWKTIQTWMGELDQCQRCGLIDF